MNIPQLIYNEIANIAKEAGLPFWLNSNFCKSREDSKLLCKKCESYAMCMFATHSLKYTNAILDLQNKNKILHKLISKELE